MTGATQTPATDKPQETRARRRKREIAALVAGVLTAGAVVLGVLAVAVVLLFASGVVPLSGLQNYVAADLQRRLGEGWTVQTRKAAIVREDGRATLRILDVDFRHASGVRLRAPEATVRYDHWSVLSGDIALQAIDIRGVTLRLQVDSQGALVLDTGESQLSWQDGVGPSDALRPETAVSRAIAALSAEGPLPSLERIALTDSRLQLVAPDGVERIGLQRADIVIEQSAAGRNYRFRGFSQSGLKDIEIRLRRLVEGPGELDMMVHAFQLDDIERLLVGRADSMLSGFPLTGSLHVRGAQQELITGKLALGGGQIDLSGKNVPPLRLDNVQLGLSANRLARTVEFTEGQVRTAGTHLDVAGRLAFGDGNAWKLEARGSGVVEGDAKGEPAQQVTEGRIAISGVGVGSASLTELTVKGPGLELAGSGRIVQTPDGPEVTSALTARNSTARGIIAVWPRVISPEVRTLLSERLEVGEIETLQIGVTLPAADFAAARRGEAIPDESLRVEALGKSVRFALGEGLPKLQDMTVSALSTGRTLRMEGARGRIDAGRNRSIALTEGSFAIADTYAARPIGRASFRAAGGVDALAALLATPALREAAPAQIDPETIRGRMDLRVTVTLPLVADIRAQEVLVQATGPLSGVASDAVMGTDKLEAGSLQVSYDRGAFAVRGEARIGGTPASIDMKQDGRGQGEAIVTMSLDQAARERRGLNLGGALTGPVGLRATKVIGRRQDTPLRVELDLARAAIDGLLPGWTKPAGRPGRMTFTLADDEGMELSDVVLEAPPVSLRGKLSFDDKGQLVSASLTGVRLSAGDDLRVEFRREAGVSRATVRGQVLDARPFLKTLMGPPPRRPEEKSNDFDLDLQIPILTGFNGEALGGATVKLSRRGGEVRQLELAGRIGRSPLQVTQGRDGDRRVLRVRSEDAGGLLRFVDLYRRAHGGELSVDAVIENDRLTGNLAMNDFRVRGEPALRRALGEQFASQQYSQGAGDGSARPVFSRDSGNDVAFTRLRAGFTRTPTRFTLRDGIVWGNEIGVSAQGTVDYARDQVDIAGTFVPSFFINNALSNLPIIGLFLGGGNGGLFAVNFRIGGAASAPSVTINPLSAIAPGILRRFVDPLGGVPQGTLTGPTAQ